MLEKFMEWLNGEIERIEHGKGNNLMLGGCYSEAIRIRQMLCNMSIERNPELDEVAEKMCQHYCRYPEAYGDKEEDNQRMIAEKCSDCPMDRLVRKT